MTLLYIESGFVAAILSLVFRCDSFSFLLGIRGVGGICPSFVMLRFVSFLRGSPARIQKLPSRGPEKVWYPGSGVVLDCIDS